MTGVLVQKRTDTGRITGTRGAREPRTLRHRDAETQNAKTCRCHWHRDAQAQQRCAPVAATVACLPCVDLRFVREVIAARTAHHHHVRKT